MLAYPIATLAIVLMGEQGADAIGGLPPKKPPTKIDFLRAMNRHSNRRRLSGNTSASADFQSEILGSSKSSATLRKKIMEKSIVAKVPGSATAANEGDFVQGEVKTEHHEHVDGTHRKLEDNAYVQNKYNSYKDGSDDAFIFNEFGFDSTTYSASYSRCASMKQFDDEIAATEDTETVFVTKHFAVFRFCPEQTCMGWQEDYAKCGCEQQCETVMQNIETYYQDHDEDANNGDDQEELCLSSCYESCRIWGQQVDMTNGNSNSNNNRKLEQEGDMYNWNRYDNNPFNN